MTAAINLRFSGGRLGSQLRYGEGKFLQLKCADYQLCGGLLMLWTCLSSLLALLLFALPAHSQLGAPLGRCGPQPYDTNWPQNQLPGERVSVEAQKRPSVDMVKLERDARELAELSATIPADINRANSGLLSKDVIDKLKRVERLSKQLRGELTR
jgi:hypothetical protein